MTQHELERLDLDALIALGEEVQVLILKLREQAAAELREHIEATASKLGMTVQQVVKGSGKPRRRKHRDDEADAGNPS
ncbi:MAG: hypothetical protein ABL907_22785 [Hyphomicrobium sp.]